MDGSDGRGERSPVCAGEWERKGEASCKGSLWLAQVVHALAPTPLQREGCGSPEGWAHGEELTRMHPPSGEARGVSNSGLD